MNLTPRPLTLLVPGRLDTRTGGYEYDRRLVAGLRALGWPVVVRELHDSFPQPTAAARADAARALAALPDGAIALVDGLALGALADEAEREADRLRLLALVHHPLAAETGLDPAAAAELKASECRALAAARRVVVTSRATAHALGEYGVSGDRIVIVEPGTDRRPLAHGSGSGMLHLLSVGALIPRKGHELLIRALAALREDRWRLTCAGSADRHPATTARLRACIRAWGLEDRVDLAGEVDAPTLAACYDTADVFVMPTLYEGYGMAVAEALAWGLPVVGTRTGAIPDLVEGRAGLVVPPGAWDALTGALARMLREPSLRERCAHGARAVRDRLPTWEDAVERFLLAIRDL